jgi:hypothetical protein
MNLSEILNEPLVFEEKLKQTKFFINQLQKLQNEYFEELVEEFELKDQKLEQIKNFIFNDVDLSQK